MAAVPRFKRLYGGPGSVTLRYEAGGCQHDLPNEFGGPCIAWNVAIQIERCHLDFPATGGWHWRHGVWQSVGPEVPLDPLDSYHQPPPTWILREYIDNGVAGLDGAYHQYAYRIRAKDSAGTLSDWVYSSDVTSGAGEFTDSDGPVLSWGSPADNIGLDLIPRCTGTACDGMHVYWNNLTLVESLGKVVISKAPVTDPIPAWDTGEGLTDTASWAGVAGPVSNHSGFKTFTGSLVLGRKYYFWFTDHDPTSSTATPYGFVTRLLGYDDIVAQCPQDIITLGAGPDCHSLVASWTAIAGATQYQLRYSKSQNLLDPAAGTAQTTELTVTLTALKGGTTYYTWVRGAGADGVWGEWSLIKSRATSLCPLKTSACPQLALCSPEVGKLNMAWNAQVGVERYEMRQEKMVDGVGQGESRIGYTTNTTFTFNSFETTASTWKLTVWALMPDGERLTIGPTTMLADGAGGVGCVPALTACDTGSAGATTQVCSKLAALVDGTGITFTWSAGDPPLARWDLEYLPPGATTWLKVQGAQGLTVRQYSLSYTPPAGTQFRLRGYASDAPVEYFNAPGNLTYCNPSATINTLMWDASTGNPEAYEIWQDPGNGFVFLDRTPHDGAGVRHVYGAPRLSDADVRSYKVRAYHGDVGPGPFSNVVLAAAGMVAC